MRPKRTIFPHVQPRYRNFQFQFQVQFSNFFWKLRKIDQNQFSIKFQKKSEPSNSGGFGALLECSEIFPSLFPTYSPNIVFSYKIAFSLSMLVYACLCFFPLVYVCLVSHFFVLSKLAPLDKMSFLRLHNQYQVKK